MCSIFRIVIFLGNISIFNSGKTEYQTTKASKARRSASFERRPSRRYSRRTMQNRGGNTSGRVIPHILHSLHPLLLCACSRLNLNAHCVFLCVCVYAGQLIPHEWVHWSNLIILILHVPNTGCVSKLEFLQLSQWDAVTNPLPPNAFGSLDCNPGTDLAFCFRRCWRAKDIMSLGSF